jgi:AraC family transcriptional regulator of adaptative response/methylated-DNA-[protein]-cysteine methyltransferase
VIITFVVSHPFRRKLQKAGSSTPLRFAQKDGARSFYQRANDCPKNPNHAQESGSAPGLQSATMVSMSSKPDLDKIRAYIEANHDRPIPLAELGRLVHSSPFTVQRHFKQVLGVSPLQYQRALRAARLRGALKQGESVTSAIYNAGFGSSSRGYDGAQLGMTPARFAKGGRGEQIGWCAAHSPFGWVIVGATERGLCWLSLAGTKHEAEASLREEFPAATLKRDPSLEAMVEAALRTVCGPTNSSKKSAAPQSAASNATNSKRAKSEQLAPPQVDLRGTAFQLKVWQALRRIPRGETRSYSQLARELGDPKATRAVARACATNRVAIVVPCHRVVGASGSLTGYRWGIERKRMLLEAETPAVR